jgi:hypothetical protein
MIGEVKVTDREVVIRVKRRKEGGIWVHAFLRERRGRSSKRTQSPKTRHDTRKERTEGGDII